jgi:putative transposase
MHAETLYQCDFFSKKIWTPTGLRQYFVLAFLHVGSRTVFVSKASRKPDAAWMKEQAEAFVEHVQSEGRKCEKLIRDYDNMFSTEFEEIIKTTGAEIKKVGPRAANMNAFVERWVQSIQQECLDHFIVFGEDHFNYLVSEWVEHYHAERPHQSARHQSRDASRGVDATQVHVVVDTDAANKWRPQRRVACCCLALARSEMWGSAKESALTVCRS